MNQLALYHFSVTQIKRSAGQSAVASAAYRSGEKLYSDYYGEYNDFSKKQGVICSEILLPDYVSDKYLNRQILWNEVENVEHGKKAQLAYSFDIALQNEFSIEENISLARQFLLDNFVSRGMIIDFSVHRPDKENEGISNPHFHVMAPIRPMDKNGKWGNKQHRVYEVDEKGNRIRKENGKFVFNAVPTTDWGSPETLEYWRKAWADICNEKFNEKGLNIRIDHRSYKRQGTDIVPTVHEGVAVRAMEKKGILTEKGEFNRFIKSINATIKDLKYKIAVLIAWIKETKEELKEVRVTSLNEIIQDYYSERNLKSYSQKGKVNNLKEMVATVNYLSERKIHTAEDLKIYVENCSTKVDDLKEILDKQTDRMREIRKLYDDIEIFKNLEPIHNKLQNIKFKSSKEKYKSQHESQIRQYYAILRKLKTEFPDNKINKGKLLSEYERIQNEHRKIYGEFVAIREDLQKLWKIKSITDRADKQKEKSEIKKENEIEL